MATRVAAFLSYAHDDDKHDNNRISRLRDRLELSIRVTAGIRDFAIIQDKAEIGWGAEWDKVIRNSLDVAVLLIPIISPLWFASPHCRDEMAKFQARQTKLGTTGLILPIYYRDSGLMKEDDPDEDPTLREVATELRAIQFEDWRPMRRTEETDLAYADAIERIAERAIPILKGVKVAMAGKPEPAATKSLSPTAEAIQPARLPACRWTRTSGMNQSWRRNRSPLGSSTRLAVGISLPSVRPSRGVRSERGSWCVLVIT